MEAKKWIEGIEEKFKLLEFSVVKGCCPSYDRKCQILVGHDEVCSRERY